MLKQSGKHYLFAVFLLGGVLLCNGCTVNEIIVTEKTKLNIASLIIPENMLLNVGIMNFEPGIPKNNDVEKTRIYPEVRKAEARYLPYHIKTTLQGTGFWGAVRIIPSKYAFSDVFISGLIEKSDGEYGQLLIKAVDITGTKWFEKSYSVQTGISSYREYRDKRQDPYQKMFNDFANDLRLYAMTLTSEDIRRIHQITELKFFADMAPLAYDEYLILDKKGITTINRLTAQSDPMAIRLRSIRARDDLVIDMLNEHYANFYYGIAIPYEGWRKISREENINYRQVKRMARIRIIIGVAVMAGSIAMDTDSSSRNRRYTKRSLQNIGFREGWESIRVGLNQRQEAKMHLMALQELSESFVAEAAPMTISIDGETRRLVGTAEAQYESWRKILKELYQTETGFASNIDIGVPYR